MVVNVYIENLSVIRPDIPKTVFFSCFLQFFQSCFRQTFRNANLFLFQLSFIFKNFRSNIISRKFDDKRPRFVLIKFSIT